MDFAEEFSGTSSHAPPLLKYAGAWACIRSDDEDFGAEEGIRTLDPLLGKEVLYH